MQGLSGLFLWASVWQQQIPYLGKAPTSGLFCQIIVALRLTNTREIFNEYHIFVRKPRDSIKSFCLGNFSMSATVQLLSFQWCGIQTYKNLSCEKTKVSNHMPPPVCKMAACFKMYRLTQKNEVTVPLRGKKKAMSQWNINLHNWGLSLWCLKVILKVWHYSQYISLPLLYTEMTALKYNFRHAMHQVYFTCNWMDIISVKCT